MPKTVTVVCREEGYDDILIYVVTVESMKMNDVRHAVESQRTHDLGEAPSPMEVFFAFDGDLTPVVDWRE